jgi:hypothetical protein
MPPPRRKEISLGHRLSAVARVPEGSFDLASRASERRTGAPEVLASLVMKGELDHRDPTDSFSRWLAR